MSYRIYNGTQLLGDVNNKSTGINGLLPATSYQLGVTNYNGNRESSKATINVKTRGIRLIIPTSLTVNSTITLNYQEYSLGLVPIGTEPAGMFGGGNKRNIQAKVISVDNGKSTVELLEPLESSSTVSIGGINLLRNSGNPKNIDGWQNTNGSILMATKHPYWKNNQENLFLLINRSTNGSEATFGSGVIKVDRNTDYTLSYWAFEDSYVLNSDTYFLGRKNGETSNFTIVKQLVRERKYSGGHAEYVSVTFNTGDIDEGYIRFDNNGNSGGNQSGLYIANIKLEKGTIATDWSPAPEDTQYIVDNTQMNKLQDGSFAAFNGYKAIYFNQ
ncbi:hypothetical protein [Ligilactobacillus salivarius]|uniref:hypothetical protein n=1 Tax=Ligilactobacillus salivarius TaxID=1624 RepID=UPI0022E4948F|nr:hypothetical protein [Ligilactobacillus salivarius]